MSDLPVGWQKVWFFLRNDADAPLPMFTGNHPVPQPKWGYSVAQQYICRLQPLWDVIWWLVWCGLMGAGLLCTFIIHRVQPLQQWEMTIWMYPGPSCLYHFFSTELDDAEINSQIWGILVRGANQNSGPQPGLSKGRGCQPLRELARAHFCLIVCHTRFGKQKQVLIACVPRIIFSTHMDQKCS
jgi:hypothetical protein